MDPIVQGFALLFREEDWGHQRDMPCFSDREFDIVAIFTRTIILNIKIKAEARD